MSDEQQSGRAGFLALAPEGPAVRRLYDEDLAGTGYVMNLTTVWAHQPEVLEHLTGVLASSAEAAGLSFLDRGILVTATASTIGDSYCSLAWGGRLAGETDPELAASVLRGSEAGLAGRERALARWARKVATTPATTSAVNAALGARPDAQLRGSVPTEVLDAVDYGRPVADPGQP